MASERAPGASATVKLDQPTFFQNWERRARSATRSDSLNGSYVSSESPHPSPKSTVAPPRVRKFRKTLAECSISAPAGTIPELSIPTIASLRAAQRQYKATPPSDESSTSKRHYHSHSGDYFGHQRRGSASRPGSHSKKSSGSSLTRRLRCRFQSSLPDFHVPECRIANSARERFPPRKERPGYEWTKTSPKDDWVERLISTSGLMQRRARSADQSPVPIVPLRPPPSRNISSIGHERTVRMETSFAKLRPDPPLEAYQLPHYRSRPSIATRTKLILAKRVRFSLNRGSSTDRSIRQKPSTTLNESRLPTRNRTTEGLHRVASILHIMANENLSRATSSRSNQSRERILPTPIKPTHRKGTFHLPAVIRNRNRAHKSTNVSYTSSIRNMRRGATPLNTPDLRETYRVKRSPSAETEEFFKIDISVRGGTSYLPSEARRVHTPPLPRDGPGQKRMGFFFDYTAPSLTGAPAGDAQAGESGKCPPSSGKVRPVRSRTRRGTHWLETQLAGVSAADEKGNESKRVAGVTNLDAEKEVVDWNVPEHLPSSPLCPRHEKHKGGGREICWMHGRNVDVGWRR
jgi:hypothetical protein